MKGQFYIISVVIIISALVLLTQTLFVKSDITGVQEIQELRYVEDVQKAMTSTFKNSEQPRWEADLNDTESFLRDKLIQKGNTK